MEESHLIRKRSATAGMPSTEIGSQEKSSEAIDGFDPIQNPGPDSNNAQFEASLAKGKQGLGEYDFGPTDEHGKKP